MLKEGGTSHPCHLRVCVGGWGGVERCKLSFEQCRPDADTVLAQLLCHVLTGGAHGVSGPFTGGVMEQPEKCTAFFFFELLNWGHGCHFFFSISISTLSLFTYN